MTGSVISKCYRFYQVIDERTVHIQVKRFMRSFSLDHTFMAFPNASFLMLFLSKFVLSDEISHIILIFQAKLHVFPQYLQNCMAKNFFTLQKLQMWGEAIKVDGPV